MNFTRLQQVYAKYFPVVLDVSSGQLLEIHEEVGDGDNTRTRKFKGLVIKTWKKGHPNGTFTVRGMSSGVSVEKIYPFSYAKFKKVLLLDEYKTRRSKLYFIRRKIGKGARMKSIISPERRGLDLFAQVVARKEQSVKNGAEVAETKVENESS